MPSLAPVPITNIINNLNVTAPIWVNWFGSVFSFLKRAPTISQGILAPTIIPAKVGDMFVDVIAKKIYVAVGITSAADWEIVN